ncbi:hypothetical protein ElyMa_005279900 [Elysia marginata]|uniref:Uncharacterized protein n=1 Tax=Elysia marginata TaxID=1093978 RepID=A0AAV4JXW5_9GAST|nr:hypothetical protein ElyMa_005279900 [Elysia marginata]
MRQGETNISLSQTCSHGLFAQFPARCLISSRQHSENMTALLQVEPFPPWPGRIRCPYQPDKGRMATQEQKHFKKQAINQMNEHLCQKELTAMAKRGPGHLRNSDSKRKATSCSGWTYTSPGHRDTDPSRHGG